MISTVGLGLSRDDLFKLALVDWFKAVMFNRDVLGDLPGF